jgi:hypothetical protein
LLFSNKKETESDYRRRRENEAKPSDTAGTQAPRLTGTAALIQAAYQRGKTDAQTTHKLEMLRATNRAFMEGADSSRRDGTLSLDTLTVVDGLGRCIYMNSDHPLLRALHAVLVEFEGAVSGFPAFNSSHEGLAVIEEEFIELRDEVFTNPKKSPGNDERMKTEAVQLAAMSLRFLIDVCHVK